MSTAVVRRLTACAVAVLIAACSPTRTAAPGTPSAGPAASPAPELSVTLVQYRRDQAVRVVQVKVANAGAVPVEVLAVGVDAPGYASRPPTPDHALVLPGRRLDLPVALGEVRCDAAQQDVEVALRVRAAGGQARELRLALPPGEDLLTRLHAAECARLALAAEVGIAFAPTWALDTTASRPVLHGALVLRRGTTSAAVEVVRLDATTLFGIRPAAATPPLRLEAGATAVELPVDVVAPTCSGHSIGESKRARIFPVIVRVGEREEQLTTVEPDAAAVPRFDALLAATCGP